MAEITVGSKWQCKFLDGYAKATVLDVCDWAVRFERTDLVDVVLLATPDHFLEVYEPSAPEFKTGDVVRRTTWSQRQRIGVISDVHEDGSLSVDYGDTTSTGVKPYRGAATGPAGVSPTGVSVPVIDERAWYVRTWYGILKYVGTNTSACDMDQIRQDLIEGEVLVTFRNGRPVTP